MLYKTLIYVTLLFIQGQAIVYDGTSNSWMQYEKWNLCPKTNKAVLTITVNTSNANGLLVYMDGGERNTDYLLLELHDGKVYLEYQYGRGNEPATNTRDDQGVSPGEVTIISIERVRMGFILKIDDNVGANQLLPNYGTDLCFGDCNGGLSYDLSPDNSNLYVGGVPPAIRTRANSRVKSRALDNQFVGEVYDIAYRNCKSIPLNPKIVDKGSSINSDSDVCYSMTHPSCVCKRSDSGDQCLCLTCVQANENEDDVKHYSIANFGQRDGIYVVNADGLDDRVQGDVIIEGEEHLQYLRLGDGTSFQFAGESQRDECLGNLDFCPKGYTLSFWLVILNSDLEMKNSVLVDNGGSTSHGMTVFWRDNALHTMFVLPNGQMWSNVAYELYPAQVYYETAGGEEQFNNYWYHYAVTWSRTNGLYVYLNGVPVGTSAFTPYKSGFTPGLRTNFVFGSDSNLANHMGIANIQFHSTYYLPEEIIGLKGVRHYYFTMNRVKGTRVVAWPRSLEAIVGPLWDSYSQLVPGVADMGLRLGARSSGQESYINAQNCTSTCFGQAAGCNFYISFWVNFETIKHGITVLDTGNTGITIQLRNNALMALIYDTMDPIALSFPNIRANQWYFVEVDRISSGTNSLWINGQIVSQAKFGDWSAIDLRHNGIFHNLLIGKRNPDRGNTYKTDGWFTIDQLDMLQGDREYLRYIGHIQRDTPPHIFYTMDKMWKNNTRYVDYFYRYIQHDPMGQIIESLPGSGFVVGKDMWALSLYGNGSVFEITQQRRKEECYNNIEKCVHGILIRGWFNIETLRQNAGFLSSGFNGIDMAYRDNRLVITASTLAKTWEVSVPGLDTGKWMFLEVSFHPKYGLTVYRDETSIGESLNGFSDMVRNPPATSRFMVGGVDGGVQVPMLVDNLEIWYGDRDYVCSRPNIQCTTDKGGHSKHFIIDFDEWDPTSGQRELQHELLTIPASGTLISGLFNNALDVNGGFRDGAEVTYILPNTPVEEECFGNLALCPEGFTVSFFVKPERNFLDSSNQAIYLLSTGTNGIDVYVLNKRLYAEARNGDRLWQVQSPNFLVEELWNQIIVMWSPIMGLVLARDDRLYIIDRDMAGRLVNEVDTTLDSRYLIGSANPTSSYTNNANGLQLAYDEMIIDYYYKIPAPITHDSFSFERTNSWYRSKVEHPKYQVWLKYGADLVEGLIGNTSSLDGTNQYIDLGDHSDSCIDNLDLCKSTGVTLSFKVKIRRGSSQGDQVVMSGNSYDINLVDGRRLQVRMMTKDKLWNMDMRSFNNLPVDEWIPVDITWTEEQGAKLYINGSLRFEDRQSESRPQNTRMKRQIADLRRQSQVANLQVGRAKGSSRYLNGEVDEIHFYRSTYDELMKKGIITHGCGYYGIVLDMEEIDGNGIVKSDLLNPVMSYASPRTVPALIGRGIELLEQQYIDVGSRLSCQSRPNECLNGYTMRVSIKPIVLYRNSYLVSSNPAEIMYGSDSNLHIRYSSLLGVWEATLTDIVVNVWYSIDISWDDENGMTVYVNNVQRAWSQNASYPINDRYDQNNHFFINRPSSSRVTNYAGSNFIVDNLEVWDAKRELLRACGLLRDLSVRHHATFPDSANGYIRLFYIPQEYNIKSAENEELYLKFMTKQKDGLLWYNEDGDIRSYIYLQDGDLYFGTTKGDGSNPQRRITFNQQLDDGLDHTLSVRSEPGNKLAFYLDGNLRKTETAEHVVRFLTGDFHIGGHVNATKATKGKVRNSFVGIFKDVKVNGTAFDMELDLFKEMWKEQFPDYVRVSCDENYGTLLTFDPEIDPICDVRGTAVTFMENSTYIYEDIWSNQGSKPSIKLRFTPAEPNGLLLFTGTRSGSSYGQFFALELYDRLLYLVTDVGYGRVRKQVSPDELEDMNVPHSTEIVFDTDAQKIMVYFDEMRREEADVPMGNVRRGNNVFEGNIYIGGHDDYRSLPWHIWSQAGFVGCVGNLQINTLSSDLQSLYVTQKAQHIVDGCRAFTDYCANDPCQNSSPCYNRKDRYECDCSGLTYADYQNDVCARLTLIGNINGTTYYDLDLGRTYKSHVNDFSTRFKTMASDGTMWMTHSPMGSDYIKAFFEGGDLKVSIDTGRQSFVFDIDGVYNDYEWHVLNVRRRGNEMTVWVDDMQLDPVVIAAQDFYIYMDEIRLGADTPNPGEPPYFFGHLNNFRWPPHTDRKPPFVDIKPIPVPSPSITFLTSEAYIRVPNAMDEMLTGFKVILMLKTQLKDALFLYQPGRYDRQYLAGLLKDGFLNIRFNFGDADELLEVKNIYLSDDRWHIIEIYRKTSNKLQVKVDDTAPVSKTLSGPLQFDHSSTMYLGGIPADILLPAGLRSFYTDGVNGYKGCMAKLLKNRLLVDLTDERLQDADIRGKDVVVSGCQPWQACIENECLHGCTCGPADSACDNSVIPFTGKFCQHRAPGFTFYQDGSPGRVIFRYDYVSTTRDRISFGFKACDPNGVLAKFSGSNDKEFIKIYLDNGNIAARFGLGGDAGNPIILNGDYTNDWYIVQFDRDGAKATLSILDDEQGSVIQRSTQTISGSDNKLDGLQLLEIGSEYKDGSFVDPYSGIITGFKHGGYNIFDVAMGPVNQRTQFTSTGTAVKRNPDDFSCVRPGGCGPGKQECMNFGVCQNNVCNCTLTGYRGDICEDYPKGHYYGYKDWQPAIDVYKYFTPVTTYEDYFAVGIMTYEKYGTIFRVENVDKSQYYHLRLDNGSVRLDFKLDDIEHTIQPTDFTVDSYDDVYYIIRLNRTRENITFTVHHDEGNLMSENKTIASLANVPFRSQNVIMSGGKVRQTSLDKIEDDWNGILGGMYYNSRYMYDLLYDGVNYNKSGTVAIAPHPFHLLREPSPECSKCFNHGMRLVNKQCDCTYTSYAGLCCNVLNGLLGFQFKKNGGNGMVMYNVSSAGKDINDLAVSFKTAGGWGDGQIMKVVSADKQYYIIVELKNDKLQVRYKLGEEEVVQPFDVNVRQQNHHRVRVHSAGDESYIQLDDYRVNFAFSEGVFNPDLIYIGGEYEGSAIDLGYYGIIWKAIFNGIDIVEEANKADVIKTGKFTVKTEGDGNFQIIPYPWPDLCDKGSPECETLIPSTYGGGGGVILDIGGANPGDGVAVVDPKPSGITTASSGAIIGAIMGGLLFASAIAFAAAGMKPGFLTLSKGMAGAAGQGVYVPVYDEKPVGGFPVSNGNVAIAVGMDDLNAAGSQAGTKSQYEDSYIQESQFDATDTSVAGGGAAMGAGGAMAGQAGYNSYNTSSTWYARDETLENQNQGAYGAGSTVGGYGRGYAGSTTGGSVAGSVYGFGTVTNPDQAFITLSEDIAVDNVVLTADGRYVVTGSNLGPPQVWNTTNGEMVTTMRGDHMGSTGLHLAANEQYLIGETMAEQAAVDMNDIQTGNHIPIRRVAVWDFNTGNPLPIAVDQLCTASCVSKDGFKVVMAMTDKFGGGTTIKVLDLLSNKVLNEMTYPDTIGVADSASCVFISPDDRFVAVGFTNSFDGNANFIIFDLFSKSSVVDSPIVALNGDPHCTVILKNDEALTGTKNGELVIWSMKTGKAQRQLTSGDATMLSQGGMPAAHDREVKEVSLSHDGKYLASASADRTVKIWSMDTESLLHTLHGHNDEVWTVDIASDNSIIVSGSQDGTIKLWRLRNGNQVTSFNATMDIFHARFSKDKKTVVALGDKYGARKLIMLQIVSQKKWRMRSS